MRSILIINETSGDKVPNTEKIADIRKVLEPAGFQIEVEILQPDSDAGEIARKAVGNGIEAVLVGGGDGTVGLVARELVGKSTVMGVVPLGTFNNIARSIGMPESLEDACALIASKSIREIDVGQVKDGPYFFEAAGCGLDATLFPVGEAIKGGQWLRWLQFARLTLRYQESRVQLGFDRTVEEAFRDGRKNRFSARTLAGHSVRLRAMIVAVGNGPYYGGGFGVVPSAKLTDGLLTVSAYRHFSKVELFRHFWSISRGQRKYSPKVETFTAAEVTIASERPLRAHADGVRCGRTPLMLTTLPKALRVFASADLR